MGKKSKKIKNSIKTTWEEFKKFINRGNALNLAIGVVIGGAFSAIVTAFTNVLLAICTWGVPGGLAGLVSVLPASNPAQQGISGIGQTFQSGSLNALAEVYSETNGVTLEYALNTLKSSYTLYGSMYVYNGAAIINWGAIINAVISFIIIALILFIILKIITAVLNKKKAYEEKLKEAYFKKHPDEKPVEVKQEEKPTELDVLLEIKELLASQKVEENSNNKKEE